MRKPADITGQKFNRLTVLGPAPRNGRKFPHWHCDDYNGNYEPDNCRWATDKEQARNKSNNRLITFDGQTKCVGEWSEITGLHPMTIIYRLNKGATPEEALSQKKKNGPRMVEYRGRNLSVTEWGRLIGKKAGTISTQLSRGYPLERILGEI